MGVLHCWKLHQLSPPLMVMGKGLGCGKTALSTQQSCPSISFSACPFFFHLELYLGGWSSIGHWLLSCDHTIAVFSWRWSAALHSISCDWWWLRAMPHLWCVLYMRSRVLFISTAWTFLCSSAISVYVSHAYNKIDSTNACSSFSLVDRLAWQPMWQTKLHTEKSGEVSRVRMWMPTHPGGTASAIHSPGVWVCMDPGHASPLNRPGVRWVSMNPWCM